MQKEAWIHTMASVILGAFCVLFRWLQNVNVFDEETGLATPHAVLSTLLAVSLLLAAAVLWYLNRRLRHCSASTEPELALADPPKGLNLVLSVAGLAAAAGGVLLFFTGEDLFLKIAALLCLISVPALLLFPYLGHWGFLGAVLALCPVVSYSYWLVISYRSYAVDPVLWSYAPFMIALAAMLLATYRLAGYLYYRARPFRCVYACCLGAVCGLTVLMDSSTGAARLILGAWSVGLLAIAGLLILNMSPAAPQLEEENYNAYDPGWQEQDGEDAGDEDSWSYEDYKDNEE